MFTLKDTVQPALLAAFFGVMLFSGTGCTAASKPADGNSSTVSTPAASTPAASTSTASTPATAAAQKLLTEKETNSSLTFAASELFTIELASNITTGYSWEVTTLATNVVKLVSSEYLDPKQGVPGAGGKQRLTFQALTAGTTDLLLSYIRPWEKNKPVEPAPKREPSAASAPFDANDGFKLSITVK